MVGGASMLALLAAVAGPVAAPVISVEPHMEPPFHTIAAECPWIFGAVSISSATYGATIKAPAGGAADCSAPVPRDNALAKLQLSCDGLQSCVFETCPCAPADSTTGPACKCPNKAACTPLEVRTPEPAGCNNHCVSDVPCWKDPKSGCMKGFEVVYSCDGMWGAVFNMVFFPLFACYIGGGVYFTVKVQGKPPVFTRANFPHPHRLLWESWYALVLDGVTFTRAQMVERGWIAPAAASGDDLTAGLLAAPATSKKPAAVDTHPEKEAKSEAAQNTQDDTKVQIIDGGESASSEEDLVE